MRWSKKVKQIILLFSLAGKKFGITDFVNTKEIGEKSISDVISINPFFFGSCFTTHNTYYFNVVIASNLFKQTGDQRDD